jgi:hypothetical protein
MGKNHIICNYLFIFLFIWHFLMIGGSWPLFEINHMGVSFQGMYLSNLRRISPFLFFFAPRREINYHDQHIVIMEELTKKKKN